MESSGAAASSWPNGLAMNSSSNREEMQQTDRPDPANTLAPPPSQVAVVQNAGVGVRAAGEQATIENSAIPMTNGKMDPKPEHEVHSKAQSSMAGHEVHSTVQGNMPAPAPLAVHHGDLGNLDTPARPVVDHGIESNVRDTIDLHETANGLFKVDSTPNDQLHDLSLYAALPDPEQLLFDQDPAIDAALADPGTPSNALVHVGLPASPTMVEEEPSTHEAYAMLKFPDSYYYVKSMNVMVGRDQHYYNAFKESQKQAKRKVKMQRRAQQSLDDYAREPSHHSQHGGDDDEEDLIGRPAHGLLSTYSDVGGAVSYVDPTDYGFESTTALTQRNRRSKNNSSSNHSIAPRSLHEFEQGDELEGELYADSHGKVHEPQEWAQVTIHPREPGHIEKISREHLIIRFDRENSRWVMDVIGNMAMHNGDLRRRGETDIVLSHDDEIIIVSVSFRFMLPNDHESEIYYLESSEYANGGEDNDLETSPAILGVSQTIEAVESSDEGDSSEEDVPLAQQSKPKKTKDKKSKTKERKLKPVKLKLKNKNAGKKPQKSTEAANAEDKAPKPKGKTPAKTGGKVPATASKTPAQEEGPLESANHNEEGPAAKSKDEALPVPSTETPLPGASQTPQAAQPTQASPPAAINLDANSAFAGADPSQLPQKRKGPGRPPKNGLISKRDDAGVKRKLKEYERQGLAPPSMNELLEMVRAEQRQKDAAAKAASRGEAAPDVAMQNVDPRMHNYSTAYASTTPNQLQQNVASGSSAPNDLPTARSTSPRPRRPARSPSPMPARESFTEEQLKKPAITYVFIIDEILQDPALDGQADLQTIYDKIQKRWPYFKYGTTTNGWQSSVRHNLLQSPRFVESGKSGKGKYWKIDFTHELDPKKRKQASPPPPALPRNGAPYQQSFNTAYQQGGQMYHSPYNPGANPVAGPSGSGQLQANGHPANGQYPQPHYGAQSGPSSQQSQPAQPQQPQPFANIVGAILEYQPRFLAPHVGKDTHDQASKQFQDALLYYSDLHAGTTPATEGEVDETQDPYKTLKQIFIQYGQGDTRSSQKSTTNGDSTATATTTAAPDSNPISSAPAATAQTANQASPSTTTAATVNAESAQPAMISANGMPASQTNLLAPPQQNQLPAANANFATQQPQQAVPPPASNSAAPNLNSYPAATASVPGPPQFSRPTPTAQSQAPDGTQPMYQPTSASAPLPSQSPIAPTQQPVFAPQIQPVPAPSQHQAGQPNGIAQFPQRPELGAQTQLAASQLPSDPVVSEQRVSQPEANHRISSPVVLPNLAATHLQQPPQVARANPVSAEHSTTAAHHPATAAVIGASPATAHNSTHAGMETGAAKQPSNPLESNVSPIAPSTDLQPPSAGVKRPAEEVDADSEAKRQKTSHEPGPGAAADVRPISAGVKRQAEGTAGDHEAKRQKGTNEQRPRAPAP